MHRVMMVVGSWLLISWKIQSPQVTQSPSSGNERERIGRVNRKVCRGRGHKETKEISHIYGTLYSLTMIHREGLRSTMASLKKIVRLCHSAKQKELFLIGVPFSGGQVKYQTNSILI